MDGPEQSVYAVRRGRRQRPRHDADDIPREATSSWRSTSPTNTHSSHPWSASRPRSTTPTLATTTRAPCVWVCCVPRSGSRRTRSFPSSTSSATCSSSPTPTMRSSSPSPTTTRPIVPSSRRRQRTGSSAMRGRTASASTSISYYTVPRWIWTSLIDMHFGRLANVCMRAGFTLSFLCHFLLGTCISDGQMEHGGGIRAYEQCSCSIDASINAGRSITADSYSSDLVFSHKNKHTVYRR